MKTKAGRQEGNPSRRLPFFARIGECLRLLNDHLAGYVSALKAMERG